MHESPFSFPLYSCIVYSSTTANLKTIVNNTVRHTYIIDELNKASNIISEVFLSQVLHIQTLTIEASQLYETVKGVMANTLIISHSPVKIKKECH